MYSHLVVVRLPAVVLSPPLQTRCTVCPFRGVGVVVLYVPAPILLSMPNPSVYMAIVVGCWLLRISVCRFWLRLSM